MPTATEVLGVPVTEEDMSRSKASRLLQDAGLDFSKLKRLGFKGTLGQTQILAAETSRPKSKTQLIMAVGVGKKSTISPVSLRSAAISMVQAAKEITHLTSRLIDVADEKQREAMVQAHAEGVVLGSYDFQKYKSKPKEGGLSKVVVVAPKNPKTQSAFTAGQKIGEAVCFARDLVNEPGGSLTPKVFASRIQAVARKVGLSCSVWNLAQIKKAELGGLLGVNRGSEQEPRFVKLEYIPKGAKNGSLAFVGKGITFDSGGLSIKPAGGMMTMKCDMGGAAAVAGAMSVIPALKLPVKVSAYLPMTDNMTGGDATRPGDVLKTHSKKTVEVLNTDAEGRLILADALSLASKDKPDAIVDLATLTGACVVALGEDIAGLMGNSQNWTKQIQKAGNETGEKVWELPLEADYRSQLESPIADLKNIGSNYGGTITAALFLKEFVGQAIPWAHLDIAGPAYIEKAKPSGGTGFGVRLLVELARSFVKPVGTVK